MRHTGSGCIDNRSRPPPGETIPRPSGLQPQPRPPPRSAGPPTPPARRPRAPARRVGILSPRPAARFRPQFPPRCTALPALTSRGGGHGEEKGRRAGVAQRPALAPAGVESMVAAVAVTGNHSRGRSPSWAPPSPPLSAAASSLPHSGLCFLRGAGCGRQEPLAPPAPASAPPPARESRTPTREAAPKRAAREFTGVSTATACLAKTPAPAGWSRA